MRLWTLHPKYLDPRGLVALWREALLAKAVLSGKTSGYRHHPQLLRFRDHPDPGAAIDTYLAFLREESRRRAYRFDPGKVGRRRTRTPLRCTRGQLLHEWAHFRRKLRKRNPELLARWRGVRRPLPHPLFRIIAGPVEAWERSFRVRES